MVLTDKQKKKLGFTLCAVNKDELIHWSEEIRFNTTSQTLYDNETKKSIAKVNSFEELKDLIENVLML